MPIDEARKMRKVMSAFHGLIKLDLEDLVHRPGAIYKKKHSIA
jgi:hypothetical protein